MMIRCLSRLAIAPVLLTLAGCAIPGLFKLSKNDFPKTGPKNPVIRVLGLWQPTEGTSGNKQSRGFSAQILFFSQGNDHPARVDGDVRIYVFDDQGTSEELSKPILEFVFPAASWDALLCKGPLGATYSVFVPYTRPGLHEAKCTLRVKYTPKQGSPIYSDMVNVVLPGVQKSKGKASPGEHDDGSAADRPESEDASPELLDPSVSNRLPPSARGASTKMPTPQEIHEKLNAQAQKVPAAELNATERRRLMREATSRIDSGVDASHVSLAGYEESETETAAVGIDASGRRTRKTQPDADDSPDADGGDETAAPIQSPSKPAMKHILDDE